MVTRITRHVLACIIISYRHEFSLTQLQATRGKRYLAHLCLKAFPELC